MRENYCPQCKLIHAEKLEFCCICDGELFDLPEGSNGIDKSCTVCIDHIELA